MRDLGATSVIVGPATDITIISWDQAAADLNNKLGILISQGDAWQTGSSPNWTSAVAAYQQAGVAGATDVGPEIDAIGRPAVTQPYTQRAWTLNAALAAVNAATPTQADAELAESYAKQMYAAYQTAIALGRSGLKSTGEIWKTGLLFGGLGLVGAWLYEAARQKRGRRARHR